MALGAGFWAALGDSSRWMHDFTSYNRGWLTAAGGGFLQLFLSRIRMYQAPFVVGGTGGDQQVTDNTDTGYFYLANVSKTTMLRAMSCTSIGVGGSTNPRPQWKELRGQGSAIYITQGDLLPSDSTTAVFNAIYVTGFIDDVGATRYVFSGKECDMVFWVPLSVGTWYVWHYNPWAWHGTVPEVVADILMKCGLSTDEIETAAFDNAYDAYDLSTGDVPFSSATDGSPTHGTWFGLIRKHEISCVRRVGQTCGGMIMECAKHSRDMYFVNESGQVSVSSFTRPANAVYGLGLANSELYGIVGDVSWTDELKYLMNKMDATWGSGTRVSGDWTAVPNGSDVSATEETGLESYQGVLKMAMTDSDSGSIAKYGTIPLDGTKKIVVKDGQPQPISQAHFPLLLDCGNSLLPYLAHLNYWKTSDATPRKIINVRTSMVGLDWGIGDKVGSSSLTGDGLTILDCRCIEREYDFDKMQIDSVLMEIPSN